MELGLSPVWQWAKEKGPLAWLRKRKYWGSLARLIVDAGPDTNVIFLDGDRLNCRSDNLVLTTDKRGHTKLRARDGIEPSHGWYNKVIFQEQQE